jgi:hypothetical protein
MPLSPPLGKAAEYFATCVWPAEGSAATPKQSYASSQHTTHVTLRCTFLQQNVEENIADIMIRRDLKHVAICGADHAVLTSEECAVPSETRKTSPDPREHVSYNTEEEAKPNEWKI